MTTFFSVDVETSGLTPATGYLLTVGIKPVAWDGKRWALADGSLYVRIDRTAELEHCTPWNAGAGTAAWWAEQDQRVQDEAFADTTLLRHDPLIAARMIAEYVEGLESCAEDRAFVANPVAFDKMWLTELFDETGVDDPFHYRSLCLRSMKYGLRPRSAWGSDRETHAPELPHHALSDAIAQAQDLVDMLAERDMPADVAAA